MVRQRQGAKACFIAGTLVLTAEGLKKIEDIRAGDRVYAKDVEGGKQEMKEVFQTFEREVDVLVHLWIGGEEIVTTQTHPFYVEGKGWTEARELTEEDCVLDSKNEKLRVEGIRIEELREQVKVYNLEEEEYHTYYVGAAEVLVHNDNCGRGSGNVGEGGGSSIPDKARDVVQQVKANNGTPPKGYKGGRTYKNIPLEDGAQKLPEGVNYKEYDINPYIKGQNRGAERIVIGDDDSVWYTSDHYYTFTQIE